MTKRAAIYVRISQDRESTELGVQRQEKDCRALADRLGLEVAQVFVENDVGASTRSYKPRPQYERMLEGARSGGYSVLLAYSNSRLTRRPREFEDLIALYERHAVLVRTVVSGDQNLATADGRAVARTIAAWDAAEAERTSERVERAARQRAEAGRWHGGVGPFGYDNDREKKSLTINRAEAKMLRHAADRLLKGDTLNAVCRDWNDEGKANRRGTRWQSQTLRGMLLNPAVNGRTSAGVTGWSAILDDQTFERVGRILNDPRRRTNGHATNAVKWTMSGGLSYCGRCGQRMVGRAGRLVCNMTTGGCTLATDHDRLERYVFDVVMTSLAKNPRWGQRQSEPRPADGQRIAQVEERIAELRAQKDRADNAYIKLGVLSDAEYADQAGTIKSALAESETQLATLLQGQVVSEGMADGLDWTSWSPLRRRNFLSQLILRVTIAPWPEGIASTLPRRRAESEADWQARVEANWANVMEKRVTITPR